MKTMTPEVFQQADCTIWNEDCITGMRERLGPESVDMVVTSIPFEELFQYSAKPEDVGNNGSTIDPLVGRFALNMRFFVDSLYEVMRPGTNACIHVQQLLAYKVQHGFMGRRNFRDAMVTCFSAGGLQFHGEFVISKNPQRMATALNLHSLQFKTGKSRSSTILAPAPNDYVLIFQKPGDTPNPVRSIYHPKENPNGWITSEDWIRDANGIWSDIAEIDVLDGWRAAREHSEEKHVCPLQLTVISRCVELYTNPVDIQPDVTVLDPFMGIGSTAFTCLGGFKKREHGIESGQPYVHQSRNVVGFELKESYYDQALRNVAKARQMVDELKNPEELLFSVADVK